MISPVRLERIPEHLQSMRMPLIRMQRRFRIATTEIDLSVEPGKIKSNRDSCHSTQEDSDRQHGASHVVAGLVTIREKVRCIEVCRTPRHEIYDGQGSGTLGSRTRNG
jgi:hypothetical protein